MTDQILLASGRDADVYALDDHRVLRRYRAGGDVRPEVEVMTWVAGHGLAVPAVLEATGTDLVMERLHGPTMLGAFAAGRLDVPAAARIMVDLQTVLHRLPPRRSAAPGDRILHLDLHPDNIVLSSRGPVLIDWRNATEGPPALDVAMSALILAEVAVDESGTLAGPSVGGASIAAVARALLAAFLAGSAVRPGALLDEAVRRRRGNPTLSAGERGRIGQAAALVREHPEVPDRG